MGSVALIDDDQEFAIELRAALSGSGWCLDYYSDLDAALDGFSTGLPDVLVVDFRMPMIDGDEVLAALSEEYPLDKVRLFVTSSMRPPDSLWERFDAFDVTFISKDDILERQTCLEALAGR